MKRIKDFLTTSEGIFAEFETQNSSLFNSLFDDIEGATLDYDFYNKCAMRYAAPILTNADSLETVVKLIISRYSENWLKIHDVMFSDYDAINPYYRETETTENEETTADSNGTTTTKNSIYAFNSDSASDSEENLTNTENAKSTNRANSGKTVIKGNNGNTSFSELMLKEIEARKLSFIDIVFNDVMQYITLSIY